MNTPFVFFKQEYLISEKLGCRLIENKFVNSNDPVDPSRNLFWDDYTMIYRAIADWPTGIVVLLRKGFWKKEAQKQRLLRSMEFSIGESTRLLCSDSKKARQENVRPLGGSKSIIPMYPTTWHMLKPLSIRWFTGRSLSASSTWEQRKDFKWWEGSWEILKPIFKGFELWRMMRRIVQTLGSI